MTSFALPFIEVDRDNATSDAAVKKLDRAARLVEQAQAEQARADHEAFVDSAMANLHAEIEVLQSVVNREDALLLERAEQQGITEVCAQRVVECQEAMSDAQAQLDAAILSVGVGITRLNELSEQINSTARLTMTVQNIAQRATQRIGEIDAEVSG